MNVEHKIEGDKVTLFIDEHMIFANTSKYPTHRDYLAYLFKAVGVEVTQWHTTGVSGVVKPGLVYNRTDSELNTVLEVTATIGVNARRIQDGEAGKSSLTY